MQSSVCCSPCPGGDLNLQPGCGHLLIPSSVRGSPGLCPLKHLLFHLLVFTMSCPTHTPQFPAYTRLAWPLSASLPGIGGGCTAQAAGACGQRLVNVMLQVALVGSRPFVHGQSSSQGETAARLCQLAAGPPSRPYLQPTQLLPGHAAQKRPRDASSPPAARGQGSCREQIISACVTIPVTRRVCLHRSHRG